MSAMRRSRSWRKKEDGVGDSEAEGSCGCADATGSVGSERDEECAGRCES